MAELRHVATLVGTNASFVTNITDLDVVWVDGQPRLYAATRVGGGVSVFDLSATSGSASLLQHKSYAASLTTLDAPDMLMVASGAASYLMPLGLRNAATTAWLVGSTGTLGTSANLGGSGGLAADLTTATSLGLGGAVYIFGARAGRSEPVVYTLSAAGTIAQVSPGTPPLGAPIEMMALAEVAGQNLLLAVSTTANTITSYLIASTGLLQKVGTIAASAGIGFSQPTVLATVAAYGSTFAILGAAESGSLSVFRLQSDGAMIAVDHITDTLFSRFDGVSAVEVVVVGERVFVLAGGADDGISVFTLLPDGRLLHLSSIADTAATTLADITALAAVLVAGRIEVFASGEDAAGISQFDLDTGPLGVTLVGGVGAQNGTSGNDLLVAGPLTTSMNAGTGDDILVTGAGDIELWGRGGRDRFVISDGARNVTIKDYQSGTDILDLTGLPFLRTMAQVTITPITGGAVLEYGGAVITVLTANGTSLMPSQFTGVGSIEITRYPPGYIAAADPAIIGTGGADVLTGTDADDLMQAWGGADRVDGGAGNDTLEGGEGDDLLLGGAGNDSIIGGTGADLLDGGAGNDTLIGGEGNDLLRGGGGNDLLQGGDDADRLFGGDGDDTLQGDAGNDWLEGGAGADLIQGGAGSDQLFGGAGNDTLIGGAGFDILTGGLGADSFVFAPGDSGTAEAAPDLITDFTPGEDRIDLRAFGQGSFIGASAFAGIAGQVRYELVAGGGVVSVDANGNALADLVIHLETGPALAAADFLF
ncbi:MAG: M10 family metallopeptidase C-terminal domain-containing protein [Phaeovulum sp.]|uniref:M10 family metallopeptidase C-terminal domain-containing protein n=1 Tax=Phaeovulum sp. TaxID=2934796 RepID=UPI002734FE2C|nr:M10 family metallopeptidase C-terminal domain-containing protein [Phaeovulum sp.]MDP3860013.1 M10 family metallopeptidase C-terminal domain-containing protein [Phaeovulum sp.]